MQKFIKLELAGEVEGWLCGIFIGRRGEIRRGGVVALVVCPRSRAAWHQVDV